MGLSSLESSCRLKQAGFLKASRPDIGDPLVSENAKSLGDLQHAIFRAIRAKHVGDAVRALATPAPPITPAQRRRTRDIAQLESGERLGCQLLHEIHRSSPFDVTITMSIRYSFSRR